MPMNTQYSYTGYRLPPEVISHAVWLYHRFCLSLAMQLSQINETSPYEGE